MSPRLLFDAKVAATGWCTHCGSVHHMHSLVDDELGELAQKRKNVSDLSCAGQIPQSDAVPTGAACNERLRNDGNSCWKLSNESWYRAVGLFRVTRIHASVEDLVNRIIEYLTCLWGPVCYTSP